MVSCFDVTKFSVNDSSRFGTISALAQSDSDNSDSEDKGQAFYAGGSEHRY